MNNLEAARVLSIVDDTLGELRCANLSQTIDRLRFLSTV
jgi:hypothetical protein